MEGDYFGESVSALMLVIACFCLLGLVVNIFFLVTLQRALGRCEPSLRTMAPGQVWLLLVPVFNLGWTFVVVSALADSLHREFTRRGIPIVPNPGKTIGYAYAILVLLSVVPFVGFLTCIPALVCWGLYWADIAKYSGRLALAPAAPA